jgi:hypothetical protein
MDIRSIINLLENAELVSVKQAEALRGEMAALAQAQYDTWQQDDAGQDEELGGGGICHLIADDITSLLSQHSIDCSSVTATDVQHVYVVAAFREGVFEIDVPYQIYEFGSMFTWTKIPNVTFTADDIVIDRLDRDPNNISMYVDDWYED